MADLVVHDVTTGEVLDMTTDEFIAKYGKPKWLPRAQAAFDAIKSGSVTWEWRDGRWVMSNG